MRWFEDCRLGWGKQPPDWIDDSEPRDASVFRRGGLDTTLGSPERGWGYPFIRPTPGSRNRFALLLHSYFVQYHAPLVRLPQPMPFASGDLAAAAAKRV